jgi:CRP/FNR family cyclic AMP-dependent transcriptional regulator
MPTPYNLAIMEKCTSCTVPSRIFCNVPEADLRLIDSLKFSSVYPKGAVLFVEGQDPRGIFIICSGQVKLTASSADGKTLIVSTSQAGDVLGLSSAILGETYPLTAETLEPCQISFIRRDDFLRLVHTSGEVSLRITETLSRKYRHAQQEVRSLGLSHSAAERLAALLLEWAEGKENGSSAVRLKVLFTHAEIAQMIGTTRETVTRLLSDFRSKGLLQIKGSTFVIPDRSQLEQMITT